MSAYHAAIAKEIVMKTWELTYVIDGSYVSERIQGATKMAARSVIVQRYKRQIDFKSVVEVTHG